MSVAEVRARIGCGSLREDIMLLLAAETSEEDFVPVFAEASEEACYIALVHTRQSMSVCRNSGFRCLRRLRTVGPPVVRRTIVNRVSLDVIISVYSVREIIDSYDPIVL